MDIAFVISAVFSFQSLILYLNASKFIGGMLQALNHISGIIKLRTLTMFLILTCIAEKVKRNPIRNLISE